MIELIDKDGKRVTTASNVVPDGVTLRVPAYMMDHRPPGLASLTIADVQSAPTAMHQPGYARLTDQQVTDRDKMLADRDSRLSSAWKKPPPLSAADTSKSLQTPALTAGATPSDAAAAHTARVARMEAAWRS